MQISYSFIIPVYNRPHEIQELLESLVKQTYTNSFEVVIIEDGSTINAEAVVAAYKDKLQISYYYKENSGPGDSRNYGMARARGNYFLILDSDCVLPPQYLQEVDKALNKRYVACFGGPDAADTSFSVIQKAINYAMTSLLTTGGIRGKKKAVGKFQPRSFNMGLSKAAFKQTGGFGDIHPGEDPDLSIRIWGLSMQTALFEKAFVYHKRRISWQKFYVQVHKFGLVRPILNSWHPHTTKITYWFPLLFCIGFIVSFLLFCFSITWLLFFYGVYFAILFIDALLKNKSLKVAFYSLYATIIQFYGYGSGFLRSYWQIGVLKKDPKKIFPNLFFK